jgi:nuclear pore complex protein Nup188
MGTLLELGNASLDLVRQLASQPAGQALVPATSIGAHAKPLDVRDALSSAARNLENVLVFGATQFALSLARPAGTEEPSGEILMEDLEEERERRVALRTSLTLAERMRRGMTGEMAADLQTLLGKAKPLLEKTRETLKAGKEDVDLTDVLITFVHDRMLVAS